MAIIAIDPTVTVEVTLPNDASEDKTVFLVGMIDPALRAHIEDGWKRYGKNNLTDPTTTDITIAAGFRDAQIVKFGAKGWRNFRDAKGQDVPVEFEQYNVPRVGIREGLSTSTLMRFPYDIFSDLSDAIVKAQDVAQGEN